MTEKYWRRDYPPGQQMDITTVRIKPDNSAFFYLLNKSTGSLFSCDIVRVDWSRSTNDAGDQVIDATETVLQSISFSINGGVSFLSFYMTDDFDAAVLCVNAQDSTTNLLKGWVISADSGETLFSLDLSGPFASTISAMRMFCRKVGHVFHWKSNVASNIYGTMQFGYNGAVVHTVEGNASRVALPGSEASPYSLSDDGEKWCITYLVGTYLPVAAIFNRGALAFERDLGLSTTETSFSPCWSGDSVLIENGTSPFVIDLSDGVQEIPVEDPTDDIEAGLRTPLFGNQYAFKSRFMTEWVSLQFGADIGELRPGYRISNYEIQDGVYRLVVGDAITPLPNVLGNTNSVVKDVIDCIRPGIHSYPYFDF